MDNKMTPEHGKLYVNTGQIVSDTVQARSRRFQNPNLSEKKVEANEETEGVEAK